MKIYTKTGDTGSSSLNDGCRTSKDSPIFSALGELDELSTRIGVLCACDIPHDVDSYLRRIQSIIHKINAHVASPTKKCGKSIPPIDTDIIPEIEYEIDHMEDKLPKLTNFIAPGVYLPDAEAHMCRTQARKVERKLWKLTRCRNIDLLKRGEDGFNSINIFSFDIEPVIFQFMNRLSDYFFVLSRFLCLLNQGTDIVLTQ